MPLSLKNLLLSLTCVLLYHRIVRMCQTGLGEVKKENGECQVTSVGSKKNEHIVALDCSFKQNKDCATYDEEAIVPCLKKGLFFGKKNFLRYHQ
jgi:hypothetical protein